MYLKPRVIPCLLIEDGYLVKTVQFKKKTYIGDPINAVKIFNEEEADELCLIDISSHKNGTIDFELLENIASEAFMPLSYGGNITSMDEVKRLFRIGYEKISFNTAIFENPCLVKEAVSYAGSQSIIASIDFKKGLFGRKECFVACGKKNTKRNLIDYIKEVEELNVGEILLNSIDNDGAMNGYDLETIRQVTSITSLPVICLGGAGSLSDMVNAVKCAGAHAVAAGSIFVFYGSRRAVLINYPTEEEQKKAGLW